MVAVQSRHCGSCRLERSCGQLRGFGVVAHGVRHENQVKSQTRGLQTGTSWLGNSSQRSANTKCPSHVLEYPEYSSWGYSITLHVCFQENTQIWAETHRRNFTVLFVRFTLQLIPGSTRRPPAPDVHFRVRAGYRPARGQRHDSHKIPGDLQA